MAYNRHNEVPVYETRQSSVTAAQFNQVLLARGRLGNQLRVPLPDLKALFLILQPDAWIIVDASLNDLPVAAWSDFQSSHRDNLHQPLDCRLRTYHAHADMILERALGAMESHLRERLAAHQVESKDDG